MRLTCAIYHIEFILVADMSDRTGQSLGSLAGYGMSESDGEEDYTTKLSGNISGSDDENSSHSQAASRTYSPVTKDDEPPRKKTAQGRLLMTSTQVC